MVNQGAVEAAPPQVSGWVQCNELAQCGPFIDPFIDFELPPVESLRVLYEHLVEHFVVEHLVEHFVELLGEPVGQIVLCSRLLRGEVRAPRFRRRPPPSSWLLKLSSSPVFAGSWL